MTKRIFVFLVCLFISFNSFSENILDTKTKDGIHMIIGLRCHKALHVMIRDAVMYELKEIWDDLPLTNSAEDLVDEGIIKGIVNWQMYGSRKPNCKAYLIKYHYKITWKKENLNYT